MWKFKPFVPKEQVGLEGRSLEIGNLKIHVRNAIAEGGFSSVYLAKDLAHASIQYALKHVICTDEESLELVMKEISTMKLLKGLPNVVTLHGHSVLDTGRTKEVFLVMEFCEKSLASFLDGRGGAAYLEEKQILLIFRDLCNAVFAMHCHSPPIAHRDLKAENLLLGSDGSWKLCDFGSTSTNHKRFDKAEEMGVEEDVIRKHTTPAYRPPEMWDLYRREVISEKVDIWALGCLLFRLCYLKSAFDGDSKLQVLNLNYRIPELPKYVPAITGLIRDTLQSPPDARPDITQVWFRVNDQLPTGLQKPLPDMPPSAHQPSPNTAQVSRASAAHRSPPSSRGHGSQTSAEGSPLGAFWTTHQPAGSPLFDEVTPDGGQRSRGSDGDRSGRPQTRTHMGNTKSSTPEGKSSAVGLGNEPRKLPGWQNLPETVKNVAASPVGSGSGKPRSAERNLSTSPPGGTAEDEIERLKELLREAVLEKTKVSSKYEKLSAICRSQRQVIQELKQAMNKETAVSGTPSATYTTPEKEGSSVGTIWELEEGMVEKGCGSSEAMTSQEWQAFNEEGEVQGVAAAIDASVKSARTKRRETRMGSYGSDSWGFGTEGFTAQASQQTSKDSNKQPAGWAGF